MFPVFGVFSNRLALRDHTRVPTMVPLRIRATALCLSALALVVFASPAAKTCTEQTGSDSLGVPLVDQKFYAMSYNWRNDSSLDDGFFVVEGQQIVADVPDEVFGFFAIASSGCVVGLLGGLDRSGSCAPVTVPSTDLCGSLWIGRNLTVPTRTSQCDEPCNRLVCVRGGGSVALQLADSNPDTCAAVRVCAGLEDLPLTRACSC